MANTVLKVEGMSCGHCVSSIEMALDQAGASGKVDLANKKVEIQYDDTKLTPALLKAVIEDQGYEVI